MDAVYSQSNNINNTDQEKDINKAIKTDKPTQFKIPLKTKDIWEDYK